VRSIREKTSLGLRDFLSSSGKLLKLSRKPGRSELWLSTKICILGIGVIGVIGFIIRFISSMFQGFTP